MLGKGRKLAIALAMAFCVGTLAFACACKTEEETKKYSVTYEAGYTGATETIPAESYAEGETITLRSADTYKREGYLFTNWSDGSGTYSAGASYKMPARDVVFTAQWQEETKIPEGLNAEKIESFPAGNLTLENGNAKAHFTAEYAETGLVITAWVEDGDVSVGGGISGNDGVSVIFAKQERIAGVSDKTYRVRADLDGDVQAATMHNTQVAQVTGLAAEAKYLTFDEKTVAGYRVKITMPYAAIGVTKDSHNAVVALGFQNADQLLYDTSRGTDITQSHTYLLVNADGTFAENPDLELGNLWGNGGTGLRMKNVWALDHDDGTADAYIEMTGLDADNNIYMRNSNVSKAYAEVQIHASELRNDERWGKFGLELIKQDGSFGYLYFVDANSGDGKNFNANATAVHYVQWSGGWIWASDTNLGTVGESSDAYAGENNYVTLGIYRNQNKVQFYVNGNALAAVELNGISAADEPMYFGLISFNIMLKVKGYKLLTKDSDLASYQETMDAWFERPVTGPDKTLDGDLADWTNEEKSNPFIYASDQGRSATVYATKGQNGVNIFYDWYHLTDKTDEEEQFWLNTNVEFRLGGDTEKQYMVAANGTHPGIGDDHYYFHTEKEGNLFHTVAEIFVPYGSITGGTYGYDDTPVPANFYVKVGGEAGNIWETGDWWRSGGNEAQGILITKNGILGATQKTMDGDLSDWAEAEWHQKNRYQWTALLGDDGLYLAVKTSAEHIAADRQFVSLQDGPAENYRWWLNQNLEIQGQNGSVLRAARVIYFGGKAYHTSFINDAGAKITQNANADDELVFELFIARQNFTDPTARSVKAWIGGQLFETSDDQGNHWNMALEGDVIGGEDLEPLPAGETWGDGGAGLPRTENWDVSHDVSTEQVPYIDMPTSKANTDNNIYMPATKGQNRFYAETKITVKGAEKMANGSYDGYPKFGVIVYSADGSRGVLFYVDAISNEAAPAINGNSVNLGYNVRTNGNWSSWNTIPGKTVGANSGVYQNDQYVTLGIYRQGIVFSLVYNGEVITTLYNAGIKENEDVYFGIVSFNLLLKAKEYKLETNEANLEKYKVDTSKKVDVDYLFCGDSYIDTAFFQTWKDAFGSLNAINLGVGGTKVEYWQDQLVTQLTHYNPKNIIIHIGVNNLDDAGESDEAVIKKLDALFKGFKQEWPNVNIYYISIVDNVQFHQFVEKYEKVNEWVQKQDVHFIDMRPHITKSNGAADLMWFYDGLHYSAPGYALLVREIGEALGLNNLVVAAQDGLGTLTADGALYLAPSAVFKAQGEGEDTVWYANQAQPLVESILPIEGAYGANVYAEAKLSIVSDPHKAQWGKAGLSIMSKTGTYYYFIDLNSINNPNDVYTNHYAALVWRPEKLNGWTKDWEWNNIQPHFNNSENGYTNLGNDVKFDYKNGQGFITLGVAKVGSKLYFTAEGHVVGLPVQSAFAADEKVAISVLNFNMEMYAKDGYATTVLDEIYAKAPAAHGSSKTIDGDLSDWTATEKTNPFRIPVDDGRSITVYAYMDEYGVNIFYDIVHNKYTQKGRLDGGNYSHWWESTNIEFRLGGDTFAGADGGQWLASVNGQRNTDEASFKTETLENGKYHTTFEIFVSYVNIAGYDYNSDYIPAAFAYKTEGETGCGFVSGDLMFAGGGIGYDWPWRAGEITKTGFRTGTMRTIDGNLSDWAEADFKDAVHSVALTEAKYAAFLGTDGLYVALRIKGTGINVTSTFTEENGGWWKNSNVEFFNDDDAMVHWTGRVMAFGGEVYHCGFTTDAGMKANQDSSEVCFEIFISNRWLKGTDQSPMKIAFGGRLYSAASEAADTDVTWQDYARKVEITRKDS